MNFFNIFNKIFNASVTTLGESAEKQHWFYAKHKYYTLIQAEGKS